MRELLSSPERIIFFPKLFSSFKHFYLFQCIPAFQSRYRPSLFYSDHFAEFSNHYTDIKFTKTSTLLMVVLFDSTCALLLTKLCCFLPQNSLIMLFTVKKRLELIFIWIVILWPTAFTAVSFSIWYSRSFLLFGNKFSTLF